MNQNRSSPPFSTGKELRGLVRMIDGRRCLGKIFLDDGRESSVMRFPESYEDGDSIFVVFPEDNPEVPPITFRVENEGWNFGTVIKLQPNGDGSIVINWPLLRGLAFFRGRDLQASPRMAVRFRLHKNRGGELTVSDLSEAPKDMAHYAARPFCGRLTRGVPLWKSGFVKNVVNKEQSWFGFIEQPGAAKNIYFNGHLFEQAYGRKAMRGDIVHFRDTPREQGPAVNAFNSSGDGENNSAWTMDTRKINEKKHIIRCPENTFSNFLEPSPDKIYFVYATNKDIAAETREVRIERVPEAIALVNSREIPEEMKLAAVDFLINADVEHPATFRAPVMRERKVEMLEQIASTLLRNSRAEESLQHEIQLQAITFQPERLAAYLDMLSPWLPLEIRTVSPPRKEEKPWELIQSDLLPLPNEQKTDTWLPILKPPSDDAPEAVPSPWLLDSKWVSDNSARPPTSRLASLWRLLTGGSHENY